MLRLRPATLFCACAVGTQLAHAATKRQAREPPAASVPSPAVVRLLSFGNASLAADVAFLAAVSHFGDAAEQAAGAPHVAELLQHSVALDPNFAAPYVLAGGGLAFVRGADPEVAALLRMGCARRPDVWQLQLYRGFWAYQRDHDVAEAAEAFAAAARLPGAPVFLGLLAVRLAASTDAPRTGLAVLDVMLRTVDDPGLREGLRERQAQLLLELRLGRLNRAARAFRNGHGRPARDVAELLADADASAPKATVSAAQVAGVSAPVHVEADVDADPKAPSPTDEEPLASCLTDPFGGTLRLGPEGAFVSAHDAQRLRLRPAEADGGRRPSQGPR